MLANIGKIALTGKMFRTRSEFMLFPNTDDRVALLYGKNGSGKSTIAQAFREFKTGSPDPLAPVAIEFLSRDGLPSVMDNSQISSTAMLKEKIFVFDENFTDRNLRIDDSGLGSIVLLGKQVGIEEEIEETEKQRESLAKNQRKQQLICEQYSNPRNTLSPSYHEKAAVEILKRNWAEQDKRIKGNAVKSGVTADTMRRLGSASLPQKAKAELEAEYAAKFSMFLQTGEGAVPIAAAITNDFALLPDIEDQAAVLFSTALKEQKLSDREQKLLDLFQSTGLVEAKTFLSNETQSTCPTCLQDITPAYRADILRRLDLIFNQEANELQEKLIKLKLPEMSFSRLDCKELDVAAYDSIISAVAQFNEVVKAFNDAIQKKINAPYEALPYTPFGLVGALVRTNQAIAVLEAQRVAFNNGIRDRDGLKTELQQLNKEIAYYDIADEYAAYVRYENERQQANRQMSDITSELEAKKDRIRQLKAQLANVEIAVEQINKALKYIFFSENRLSLRVGEDGRYQLLSKGQEITPKNVSCGERNAISLCYFFTDIGRGLDWDEAYRRELFLVIDDPISSFDLENKVGIASFLRQRLAQVLQSCMTSKVLFMTHDIQVVYDMQKAFEEIDKATGKKAHSCLWELHKIQLIDFKYRTRNEYSNLMRQVLLYARGGTDQDDDWVVGNVMRRMLEAFSTFSYTKGIEEISTNSTILSILDEAKRSYFENLMYRLVLNNESHYNEHIKCAPSMDFFDCLSSEDKQRTARDVLCLMYLLNKEHVCFHLLGEKDVQKDIEKWCAAVS